jgi:hypothetical protein
MDPTKVSNKVPPSKTRVSVHVSGAPELVDELVGDFYEDYEVSSYSVLPSRDEARKFVKFKIKVVE